MVAKAAWTTVEPEISLASFLVDEETPLFPASHSWDSGKWWFEESETRCDDDEAKQDA